jgi:hypothetical protein
LEPTTTRSRAAAGVAADSATQAMAATAPRPANFLVRRRGVMWGAPPRARGAP